MRKTQSGILKNLFPLTKRQKGLETNIERRRRSGGSRNVPAQDSGLRFGAGVTGTGRWGRAAGAGGRRRHEAVLKY